MIDTEPRRFEPDAPAALDPRSLGRRWGSWREAARVRAELGADGWPKPYGMVGDVAVVSVDGPLMQRGGYWWDGHDSVAERVKAALAEPKARTVMMKMNTPGGIAAGCFAAALAIRAAVLASGKTLVVYVDEQCCSAGYALACFATRIYLPPSGEVGSIGVLSAVVSTARGLEAEGVDVRVIRSGKMKALGHPADPISEAAIAREQADVDALAQQFFALVASARGLSVDAVAALEGDTRMGHAAVAAGLADGVMTFEEAVKASTTISTATAPNHKGNTMSEKLSAAVLAMAGTTDDDQALGRIAAWKDGAARAATLEAEVTSLRAENEKTERAAVIADGLAAKKLSPAQAEALRAGTGFLASLSTAQLRSYLAEAAPQLAADVRAPAALPSAEAEVTLTDEEKRQAKAMRVSEADMLATKKQHLGR